MMIYDIFNDEDEEEVFSKKRFLVSEGAIHLYIYTSIQPIHPDSFFEFKFKKKKKKKVFSSDDVQRFSIVIIIAIKF